jgi:hypothetical protein
VQQAAGGRYETYQIGGLFAFGFLVFLLQGWFNPITAVPPTMPSENKSRVEYQSKHSGEGKIFVSGLPPLRGPPQATGYAVVFDLLLLV